MFLRTLELEQEYISNRINQLGNFLQTVYDGLVSSAQCLVQVDESNILCLQIQAPPEFDPPVIQDYHVPILINELSIPNKHISEEHNNHTHDWFSTVPWDITLNKLLPFIDGRKCVKQLATEAEV